MTRPPDDPDAPWKPGYSGDYHLQPSAPEPPGHDVRRPTKRTTGALVVVALVLVGVVVVAGRDGDRRPPAAVPWSATFDTVTASALTSDPDVVVVLLDVPGTLVALDHRTGAERWRRSTPGAAATGLDIVDGVALVRHVESDASGRAVAVDTTTGDVLWSVALEAGEHVAVVGGVVWRSRVRSSPTVAAGGAVVDLRTGRPTGETGPSVDRTSHEHLITRWGTESGGPRARLQTDLGSIEAIVDHRAVATTLSFTPDANDSPP